MKSMLTFVLFCLLGMPALRADVNKNETYQREVNGIKFRIDPRIELYNIIAMLAGHHGMTLSNIPYKQQCLDYFSKYKDLEAPQVLRETWKNGWGVDDPMFFMLRLDNDLNLSSGLNQGIINRGGGRKQVAKLAKAIKEFAERSNFQAFFYGIQKEFYQQILAGVAYNFKDFRGIEYLERYYGETHRSYYLILNINGGYGNFGTAIQTGNGKELYAIVETNTHTGDIPTYTPSISIASLIFHEFSHGFVNPILDRYREEINKSKDLYEPIAQSMRHQAYWSWNTVVIEHIVNTLVTRVAEQYYGKPLADKTFYKLTIARRFIYTDAIIEKLKLYEKNRNQYRTFKDFVPGLITVFDTISSKYIEEKQEKVEKTRHTDIQRVPKPYEYAKDSTTYFIVSTHEPDKTGQKQLHDFVARYRDNIAKKIHIIADDEALNADLTGSDLVIFGTVQGNSFLKKYIKEIPITITDSFIITNKITYGNRMQLVTSWVNPFNTKKQMTIYTAQDVKDIEGFTSSRRRNKFHYWVAKDLITLEKGDYEKYSRVWMPKIY